MRFGQLDINPVVNPAVLDTGTWESAASGQQIARARYDWLAAAGAARSDLPFPASDEIRPWKGSVAIKPEAIWLLAGLSDQQDVFLRIGAKDGNGLTGPPIAEKQLGDGRWLVAFAADAAAVDRYSRQILPEKGPRALGATPRLGIGTRMTTQVWPGIFDAMTRRDMAANSIQNSIRELSLLDDLLEARPPETNYSTGIGQIEAGWTGSTYEGLWVAGVLAALKSEHRLCYGADADHIQVKRGPAGLERTRRVIRAARYYSFYTLDMADVLDYAALKEPSASRADEFLNRKIPDATERRGVLAHHTQPFVVGGRRYQLDAAAVGRFVGKYWDALRAVGELTGYIASLKDGVAFDLELTIDEHPPEVAAFDCLTTNEEVLFLTRESQRRGLPITHLAPNFGQEKGHDYRAPDGLEGLEQRVHAQFEIASEFGLMLDVHSGDDLKQATRRVFGRATGGHLHFKVSPMLQLIYARLLREFHPPLFERWWEDAVAYARREAANGSPVAQECLAALSAGSKPQPSPDQPVFHYYSFPFVGRRNQRGQFLHRHEFYQLSPQFCAAYQKEVSAWLCQVADDVFTT